MLQCVGGRVRRNAGLEGLQSLILADGNEFHFGGDQTLAGVPQLSDGVPFGGVEWAAPLAFEAGEFPQAISLGLAGVFSVLAGKVAVVVAHDLAAVVWL